MAKSRRSRKRDYAAEHVPLDLDKITGGRRVVTARDGQWLIQEVTARKEYVCPGCRVPVSVGTRHVVAWPHTDAYDSRVDERRHWHVACWQIRLNRGW